MDFNSIDELTSPETSRLAEHSEAQQKQAKSDLAKAYSRCFKTSDGKKVLADLVQRMIYNNDPPLDSPNITYVAGYKNGEAGAIKYIIHQLAVAEVL